MNEERLGSAAAFAKQLALHLDELGGPTAGLPSPRELEQLVELAFFAGLHEEEARRSQIALAWTGGVHDCTAAVALSPPVRATPKSLAKLSPAVQGAPASLAVRPDGDDLMIWALLQHGVEAELPLTIRSLAAGVLRVDWRGVPRALYARGEALFLAGAHATVPPAERLTTAFAPWARAAAEATRIDPRAATITHIAARALSHGHGGMILIVPAGAEARGIRMHYEAGDGADLLASRHAELAGGLDAQGETKARFDAAVDFVARLTATDNALLLDTDLRIRGFGVQVVESEASLQPFRHIDPYTGDSHIDDITTFKGTRHPAGVIFCLRQDGEAAAIIASQDSRLSLVVKDAHGVAEVLGSYERGFGWR